MSQQNPPLIHTSPRTPTSHPQLQPQTPQTNPITLDLLLKVLSRTLLHPWIAWILVLSLRAQVTPPTDPAFILATSYAILLTLLAILKVINARIAHGLPRAVDWSEEVVVVTGGASGLGLLVARIYGLRGASVAVLDVREERCVEGWGEVQGVRYYRCDIGERGEVERVVGEVERDMGGPPTVLVNCAAARINGQLILSLSAEAFQRTIQTNLLAVFHTCQVFLPRMLSTANGGTIVNVSSVLGQLSAAGLADYSVSKAGLSAFHRTLEAELRASGDDEKVKLVLVETGQVATPLFKSIKTPNAFFAPVLEPVQVAREIVAAIDEGKGGVVRLPTFAKLVNWYAVLPAGVQRVARYLSGIDQAVAQGSFNAASDGAKTSSQQQQQQPLQNELKSAKAD